MEIAFFVWEYPPLLVGGLGTYAQYITREFVKKGHKVTVFTLNPGDLPTHDVWEGVEVHRPLLVNTSTVLSSFVANDLLRWGANLKFFSDIFTYNLLSTSKFVNELIRKEGRKFDVVSVHDWLSSMSGVFIKEETGLKVVFHTHSTEWGRSYGNGSKVVIHLENTSAQLLDRVITVSYAMKEDLARHGWPEEKISVVWNGVDPKTYDPARVSKEKVAKLRRKYGIGEEEKMILFIGRLTWVKGVRNLIQAMPYVIRDHPKVKLVILGKGELQHDITELANRLGISEKVIYRFEFVPEDERIAHYAACDLCVFPSIYEPFGIVSLEAMSMEKPLVVGARGVVGFREQVVPSGPERCGVHINGEDPGDIAWGIKEVLADDKRAKEWGKNGRARVLKYFTWDKAAQSTLDIYEEVVSKG
jgi:glycosyltransferase involved in cell wall biosynthesis